MLSDKEVTIDYFRNEEGENKAITVFERYAAGGLEILNAKFATSGLDTPYLFTYDLISLGDDNVRDIPIDIF